MRIKYKSEEIDKETYKEAIASIENKIEILQAQKEEILYEYMKNVSKQVNSPKFKFSFSVGEKRGKPTYELGGSEAQYYAIKQLQYNVRKTFKVKQSDRYKSLKQIKLILKDGLPKIIIRTDISSFYENIPQGKLCSKIEHGEQYPIFSKRSDNYKFL